MTDPMRTMVLLSLVLLCSCTPAPKGNSESDTAGLTEPPVSLELGDAPLPLDLGDALPPDLEKECTLLCFFDNNLHDQYAWDHAGIEYELLTFADVGTINGIVCRDDRFVTPEGVRIGQTLKEVQSITEGKYQTMRGFGYWVPLSSGWNAVFFQGDSLTDGPLAPDAQVALIAKSTSLWTNK